MDTLHTLHILVLLCLCCKMFVFQIKSGEGITITKEGTFHKLRIHKVTEEFAGKYKFEADGRKTEALIVVEGTRHSHYMTITFN